MNPVDHPHGGGEGRTSGGRNPVSGKGFSAKGKKTRKINVQISILKKVKNNVKISLEGPFVDMYLVKKAEAVKALVEMT